MEIKEKTFSKRAVLLITCAVFFIIALIFTVISIATNRNFGIETDSSSNISYGDNSSSEISDEKNFNSAISESQISEESIEASHTIADVEMSDDVSDFSDIEAISQTEEEISHGWIKNKYGYIYLYGDSGYEQFNYGTKSLERYVESLNVLAAILPENANYYNITAPVSSTFASIPREIYTADDFYNKSQAAFVSTVESKLDDRVNNIAIIPQIEEKYNNGEYIFFRTDRNWTALGAYIAYTEFCANAGIHPYALSSFPEIKAGDYLGRFYLATEAFALENNPDELICYSTIPTVKTTLTVYDYGTVYTDYTLCGNYVDIDNRYDVYLGKSAGRYEINTTASGGSMLIIGDSSAYPMIPFLASHYSKIDMIDPQYFDTPLSEFLVDHQYDDILTICYSTNATSGDYIPTFNSLTGVTENNE